MPIRGTNQLGFSFTPASGIEVCFYEPEDVDPHLVCSAVHTYINTPALTLDKCCWIVCGRTRCIACYVHAYRKFYHTDIRVYALSISASGQR